MIRWSARWLLYVCMLHTGSGLTFSPSNSSTNNPGSLTFTITFDQAVQPGVGDIVFTPSNLDGSDQYLPAIPIPVQQAAVLGTQLAVTVELGDTGARYSVGYATGVLTYAASGVAVPALTEYWFSTVDTQPPAVVTFSPVSGTAVKSTATTIVLTFDESVTAGVGNIVLVPMGGSSVAATVQVSVADASTVQFSGRTVAINATLTGSGGVSWLLTIPVNAVLDLQNNSFPGISTNTSEWWLDSRVVMDQYWILVQDPSARNPNSLNNDPNGQPKIQHITYGSPPRHLVHQRDSVTPATNTLPRTNLSLIFTSSLPVGHFGWIALVAPYLAEAHECHPAVAGAQSGGWTPSGDRTPPIALAGNHTQFEFTAAHLDGLIDSSTEFAICFATGDGSTTDTSWWDSRLRVKVSAISEIHLISSSEDLSLGHAHHEVPRERHIRFEYDAGVLAPRQWLTLVAATSNDNQPCSSLDTYAALGALDGDRRAEGAMVQGTLWSGAFEAGKSDRIVMMDTVPMVHDTELALCYGSYDRVILNHLRWILNMSNRRERAKELKTVIDLHTLALVYIACNTEAERLTILEIQSMNRYRQGWHDSGIRVTIGRVLTELLHSELPVLETPRYVTLGVEIVVHFDSGPLRGKHSELDWIGLYRKVKHGFRIHALTLAQGECDETDVLTNGRWALSDRHQCWLRWYNIPAKTPVGHVIFEFENYMQVGEYEARYFYGDSPSAIGAYAWRAQGYVCNTWLNPSHSTDHYNADGQIEESYGYASSGAGNRTDYSQNRGLNHGVEMSTLSAAQCSCDPDTMKSGITVVKADYGANCMINADASSEQVQAFDPQLYNQTENLARACNGRQECRYTVDEALIGNPFPGVSECRKTYRVWFTCQGSGVCPDGDPEHQCFGAVHKVDTEPDQILSISCPQQNARDQCLTWRAACGSCALDAVATSDTITVVASPTSSNSQGERNVPWQNTEGLPGFEWP